MPTRILIPAKDILGIKGNSLDLVQPSRCSRCNSVPASQFETHELVYEAGLIRHRQFGKNFRSKVKFCVRLPLCEPCYQANFIENPDSCQHDPTALGKIAYWRSLGLVTGSLITCLAFILLMKVIPLPAAIPWMQSLWLMLIGLALLIYAITLGAVEIKNRQIRQSLNAENASKFRRAELFAKMQLEDPRPMDIAVTATLQNDGWAEECATFKGWTFEKIESKTE